MIPFALPLAVKALPWRLIAMGAGVIAILLAAWWGYSAIYAAGQADTQKKWDDAQRAAEAEAAADSWTLVGDINEIDTKAQQTVEKIRAVHRDKPRTIAIEIARDLPCLRVPDRLLDATNRYTADLAAASGHRVLAVPAAGDAAGR